jgi:hypothetical protein
MRLTFGTNNYNQIGLYCNPQCARQDGCVTVRSVAGTVWGDEDDPDYWEQHHDGSCTPVHGHCCDYCDSVVWDDEDLPDAASFIGMMSDNDLDDAIANTKANGSTYTLAALQDEKAKRQTPSDYWTANHIDRPIGWG